MEIDQPQKRATTVIGICHNGSTSLAADGQITFGDMIIKHGARKIRTLHNGQVIAGFAGAVADAVTLLENFETHLSQSNGNLRRAAVELVKEWRTDRSLQRLDAQLIVADIDDIFVLSGDGDLIQPDDGIVAIGSGAPYATAAAQALVRNTSMSAAEMALEALAITARLCVYTNDQVELMSLPLESHDERPA